MNSVVGLFLFLFFLWRGPDLYLPPRLTQPYTTGRTVLSCSLLSWRVTLPYTIKVRRIEYSRRVRSSGEIKQCGFRRKNHLSTGVKTTKTQWRITSLTLRSRQEPDVVRHTLVPSARSVLSWRTPLKAQNVSSVSEVGHKAFPTNVSSGDQSRWGRRVTWGREISTPLTSTWPKHWTGSRVFRKILDRRWEKLQ